MSTNSVITARDGKVLTVTINRPEVRNAVDSATADALADAFKQFEADDELCAAGVSSRSTISGRRLATPPALRGDGAARRQDDEIILRCFRSGPR